MPYIESPDLRRSKLEPDPSEDSDKVEVTSDTDEEEEQMSQSLSFGIPIPTIEHLPTVPEEEGTTPKQEHMSTTYANILTGTLAVTTLEPTEPADVAYLSIATALATTTLETIETTTTSYITPSS